MLIGEFEVVEPVPELKNTCAISMLRPWIDVGRVGTLGLNRLEQHLGAKELGRLAKPGTFFDFTRYRPRMRMVAGRRVFTTPNTIVHHAHDDDTDRDFLFVHVREPHAMGEDYADAIVTLLKHFDVTEHCRIGGMYDSVPHTRPLLVTGTLEDDQAEKAKGLMSPRQSTYQGPTSIVNLVTEALTQLETRSSSLMVHLPQYVQLDEDHMGASRLMEVLCALYGFPASLADNKRGQKQYLDISRAVETNSEVRSLITQLETYYDRVLAGQGTEEETSFAPDVEKFLREMTERFDNGRPGQPEDADDAE
ncbi:MAG: PAC2 family protein [Chloroflexi bacterium]|nr:PAC2 family protein [Chloroflexota bacterium]